MTTRENTSRPLGSIGDLVQGPAVTVETKATLQSVAHTLGDLGIGIVIVCEAGAPVGVLSERDLVWAIARDAALDEVWAADVMTPNVISVAPATALRDAASTMIAENARHILVDGPGLPAVVSIRDVLAALLD